MYVVFFLLIITGNYIWGELVVPHYRNVFSGVLVVFILLNLLVVSSLEKVFFAYLVFFLLLYHFIFSEIQTYFLYLSIYLSISITFLFVQGSVYIGYCSSVTIAMDVHPLQRVLVYLLWFNSCLLQIVTVFIFNDPSTFWLAFSPLQQFHAAHQLHLEFCGLFITSLSILIQFLDCCRNELI